MPFDKVFSTTGTFCALAGQGKAKAESKRRLAHQAIAVGDNPNLLTFPMNGTVARIAENTKEICGASRSGQKPGLILRLFFSGPSGQKDHFRSDFAASPEVSQQVSGILCFYSSEAESADDFTVRTILLKQSPCIFYIRFKNLSGHDRCALVLV